MLSKGWRPTQGDEASDLQSRHNRPPPDPIAWLHRIEGARLPPAPTTAPASSDSPRRGFRSPSARRGPKRPHLCPLTGLSWPQEHQALREVPGRDTVC